MEYSITVDEPWFTCICNGSKNVEGRLNLCEWDNLKERMLKDTQYIWVINGSNKTQRIQVVVDSIVEYNGPCALVRYLETESVSDIFPNTSSIADACEIYLKFWEWQEIEENGILAIRIWNPTRI